MCYFELQYIIDILCYEHNKTPFLVENNRDLTAPIDGIIPRTGIKAKGGDVFSGKDSGLVAVRQLACLGEEYQKQIRKEIVLDYITSKKGWER